MIDISTFYICDWVIVIHSNIYWLMCMLVKGMVDTT